MNVKLDMMKKILLIVALSLLGMSSHSYGQATCDATDITITSGVNGATETQHAQNTLQTQSGTNVLITGSANVTYKAGTSITLNPGFKVDAGSQFLAEIESCTPVSGNPFVTEWVTTSANETITIPTFPGITYNYEVDWSYDGVTFNAESIGTGNLSKTYTNPDTYTVAIRGTFPRIYFNNSGDKNKIIKVVKWGSIAWTSMEDAFHGCSYLNIDANAGQPNLSGVNNMSEIFRDCSTLNADISDWIVSGVTSMHGVLRNADNFNYSLGGWTLSSNTDMSNGLDYSGIDITNLDDTLNTWKVKAQNNNTNNVIVGVQGLANCYSGVSVVYLINNHNWTINITNSCRSLSNYEEELEQFSIHPNPANNYVYISGLSEKQNETSIQILDVSGRVVLKKENQTEIDVSSLKSGVYFLQILGKENIVKKFIKL